MSIDYVAKIYTCHKCNHDARDMLTKDMTGCACMCHQVVWAFMAVGSS